MKSFLIWGKKTGFYNYSLFLHWPIMYCFFPKSVIEEACLGLGRKE